MTKLRHSSFAFFVFLLALCFAAAASASPKTQIRLLLSAETARPGDVIWAGLEMDMPSPWHTYWRNGGDAGEATEIKWTLPKGVTAGEINWPLPEKEIDTVGDTSLVTYIYTNQVVLLVPLTLDKSLPSGLLTLTASAKWMECSDICVMADKEVSATLAIGDEAKPSPDAAAIGNWRKKVPQPDTNSTTEAHWSSEAPKDNERGLIIQWKAKAIPADFYPYASTNFGVEGMTEILPLTRGGVLLRKIVKKSADEWPKQIEGILVGRIGHFDRFGMEEHLKIQPPVAAPSRTGSFLAMLILAFVGGLILNVMPCVLPVIALKILGFVNQSMEEPRRVRQLGAVYGSGVLVSFLVLAGMAIAAQRAGGVANWGDAFRNPQFQVILTILMTLIALNLFGVFEITLSGKALGAASELSARPGFPGAFFNGVLATLLATPCTAPFLGVALAFAFTQPPLLTVLVFLAAGLGLAFPFVLLCWNPGLLKLMPKPGAWMEKFKNAMGFPMLATAVWLMWVSSSREDDSLWLGLFLVVLALAAWIWGQFVQRGAHRRTLAAVICLLLLGADYWYVLEGRLQWRSPPQTKMAGIDWKTWSAQAVEDARHSGHPVLVDFTAKSCLTCKLNLASSIEIDRTRAKLRQIGAVAFKADYTQQDPAIAQELRRFNTSGVPLVLVYSKDPGQPPQVLPTFLTPAIVLNALDQAAK
ncbi:MAG: protein-disulfide reductase DsbD domain-containing protein [Verrucomicrobiota bacterium]|jgi:thiol:disulfide interchange protein DsbD